MNQKEMAYEPPKAKIYRFDDNDRILTASTGVGGGTADPSNPTAEYAANALNKWMSGTNTTIEKEQ